MNESQVEFVEPKGFTINFPTIGPSMAIRAEGDEIVVLVRFTVRPRDNVMNVDFDVSTGGDGAAMASLDENASFDVSRYWRAVIHKDSQPTNAMDQSAAPIDVDFKTDAEGRSIASNCSQDGSHGENEDQGKDHRDG